MRTISLFLIVITSSGCVALRKKAAQQGDRLAGEVATRQIESNSARIEAAIASEQDPEVKAAMQSVVAENRALQEKLQAEVAERTEAGEELPWLKTLAANWLEVLMALGLLGAGGLTWKQRAALRGAIAKRDYVGAAALAAKDGIGRILEEFSISNPEVAELIKTKLNEAVARSPDLGIGGLKEHIDKAVNSS